MARNFRQFGLKLKKKKKHFYKHHHYLTVVFVVVGVHESTWEENSYFDELGTYGNGVIDK